MNKESEKVWEYTLLDNKSFKVIVLGDPELKKTKFVNKLIGENDEKVVKDVTYPVLENKKKSIEILNVPTDDTLSTFTKVSAAIILYDRTKPLTWISVLNHLWNARKAYCVKGAPIMMVDIADASPIAEIDIVTAFAEKHHCMSFIVNKNGKTLNEDVKKHIWSNVVRGLLDASQQREEQRGFAKQYVVNQLDSYLSVFNLYNAKHRQRAESFQENIRSAQNLREIKQKIRSQKDLFDHPGIGVPNGLKHEQPIIDHEKDQFYDILDCCDKAISSEESEKIHEENNDISDDINMRERSPSDEVEWVFIERNANSILFGR